MPIKMLLVDDEELFLKSLKDGLDTRADLFETDICFSVNDAIKFVASKQYDLVVTDIRMPEKSGIELLLHLKTIRFPGKVMVMSAHNTDENANTIKSLGAVEVIKKPFEFGLFQNIVLERFREVEERTVTFESIDLVTVMQIINVERKNTALQIDTHGEKGTIYFLEGEIIHACYKSLQGEEALLKLVTFKDSIISVKRGEDKVKSTIKIPFTRLIIKVLKTIDEIRRNQQENDPGAINNVIKKILKSWSEVIGYVGAGVYTPKEKFLEKNPKIKDFSIEEIGSALIHPLYESGKMAQKVQLGDVDMIQLFTGRCIILGAYFMDEKILAFLVLQNNGNVGMGKMKFTKGMETLKMIFKRI